MRATNLVTLRRLRTAGMMKINAAGAKSREMRLA
jgi:hypothetical protein